MPVSVTGPVENGVPERLVTEDVGLHIMAAPVLEVRRLLLPPPLEGLPRVTVTRVRGTPATVTVVAVMVASKVMVLCWGSLQIPSLPFWSSF